MSEVQNGNPEVPEQQSLLTMEEEDEILSNELDEDNERDDRLASGEDEGAEGEEIQEDPNPVPTKEEEEAPPPVEETPKDEDAELQAIASKFEEKERQHFQREAEHWRRAHDSLTGKIGPELDRLRQENALLQQRIQGATQDDGYTPAPVAAQPVAQQQPAFDPHADRIQQLGQQMALQRVAQAGSNFEQEFELTGDLRDKVTANVSTQQQAIQEAVATGDPDHAQMVAERVMFSAMRQAMRDLAQQSRERKQQQRATTQQAKRMNSPVGATKSAPVQSVPEITNDSSLEDVIREMKRRKRPGF